VIEVLTISFFMVYEPDTWVANNVEAFLLHAFVFNKGLVGWD